MWSSLISTAGDANRNFELHAIFNPASGPGVSRDPNYLDNSGNGPLNDFRLAGGITYGYVATGNATRSLDDVKADVNAYLRGDYAGFVDGIFFDEMSNDLANVGYYKELHNYAKSLQASARTLGNPGTTFVNNPSGQSTFNASDYVNSLETIVSFENTNDEYANNYTSFAYLENLDSRKIAHIVHTQSVWDTTLLDKASKRGAEFLFVTDDILPNPYDKLPSYWGQFTSDVSAFNVTAVPEPSSMSLLAAAISALVIAGKSMSKERGQV